MSIVSPRVNGLMTLLSRENVPAGGVASLRHLCLVLPDHLPGSPARLQALVTLRQGLQHRVWSPGGPKCQRYLVMNLVFTCGPSRTRPSPRMKQVSAVS